MADQEKLQPLEDIGNYNYYRILTAKFRLHWPYHYMETDDECTYQNQEVKKDGRTKDKVQAY